MGRFGLPLNDGRLPKVWGEDSAAPAEDEEAEGVNRAPLAPVVVVVVYLVTFTRLPFCSSAALSPSAIHWERAKGGILESARARERWGERRRGGRAPRSPYLECRIEGRHGVVCVFLPLIFQPQMISSEEGRELLL